MVEPVAGMSTYRYQFTSTKGSLRIASVFPDPYSKDAKKTIS